MSQMTVMVGDRIVVTTPDGEQDDEVESVVAGFFDRGLWMVDTRRNGRVVVMPRWASSRRVASN